MENKLSERVLEFQDQTQEVAIRLSQLASERDEVLRQRREELFKTGVTTIHEFILLLDCVHHRYRFMEYIKTVRKAD